ncbi:MAG: ribosome small subunit-dependent GTPase A [Candidatus Zixiibacteriota bacterium]|nr:MAG: ribosome small subunit-dependent GTPase A [candidate division Zixibacteria bacterium]
MNLSDLGFDAWFRDRLSSEVQAGHSLARVTAVNRDNCLIRNETSEVPAEMTGRLLYSTESTLDLPVVGDWVLADYFDDGGGAVIHAVLPRKSFLRRKTAGKKVDYQMIAANLDAAFITQACTQDFNLHRLERYLVMVHEGRVEPVVLLTKADLVSPEELESRLATVCALDSSGRVLAVSNVTGYGLDLLRQMLEPGKTYGLLGSSGVGKSTLINRLAGRDLLATGAVRDFDGKGRHTTSRRELIVLDGGAMLVDTPGMKVLGNMDAGEGLEATFADLHALAADCRFDDCTHTRESGCALLAAVRSGQVDEDRYQGYLKLLKEGEFNQLSYAGRRKKDRDFGRFIKIAKKDLKARR